MNRRKCQNLPTKCVNCKQWYTYYIFLVRLALKSIQNTCISTCSRISLTQNTIDARENGASTRDWLNEFSIAPNTMWCMYDVKWRVEKSSFLFDFQLYELKRGSRRLSGIYLCLIYLSCFISLASDAVSIIGIYLVFIRIFIRIFLQPTVEGKRFINFLPFYD